MNEHLQRLLQNSKNFAIWLAIGEHRFADALREIPLPTSNLKRRWWKLGKKRSSSATPDPILAVAHSLISDQPAIALTMPDIRLKTANEDFPEWIRFCTSVYYSPDMIEAAAALLVIEDKETAKKYYQAVVADFQPIANQWQPYPDEPITEEDFEGAESFRNERQMIERMIQKGELPPSIY